jgi:hypothetical protein
MMAQDAEVEDKRLMIRSDFQFGLLVGGQISNEQFIYKSGPVFQYGLNTAISPWMDAGLGMSVQLLETEVILPIFLDFKARLRADGRSPFIGVNIGSSSGWSEFYRNFQDYEYSGGFYFSPYYAMQFPLSDKASFLVSFGYIHQVGHIEYFTDFDERFIESFSMDFLTIRAGLRL